jgi:hypothetical protein
MRWGQPKRAAGWVTWHTVSTPGRRTVWLAGVDWREFLAGFLAWILGPVCFDFYVAFSSGCDPRSSVDFCGPLLLDLYHITGSGDGHSALFVLSD